MQQAGVAIEAILKAVQTVNNHIHQIEQTADEQVRDIDAVSAIVNDVKTDAWQSMELVQQTTRSAHHMTHQAVRLQSVASAFQIAT